MGCVVVMVIIGRVLMVRYITFSNVHRLKCTLNKFTESGRQRKVQNIGEGKRVSLDVGVRPPRFLKGATRERGGDLVFI